MAYEDMLTAAAGLLLIVSSQLPLSAKLELPTGQVVTISADNQIFEGKAQRTVAKGHAELRTEGAQLRADEISYSGTDQIAEARGHVMLVLTVSGQYAALADSVRVKLENGTVSEVFVEKGLVMQKSGAPLEQLYAAKTPDELKAAGKTSITLTGTHLKHIGKDEWQVDGLSFTPCDCDPREPSWHVSASRATVYMDDQHATLISPKVYVQDVPVFWLPALYLPISDRRSGLLVPKPNVTSLSGFSLEQPVFLTLGRSYDVTLTPGYFFGNWGKDAAGNLAHPDGIAGPRLLSEFRYAPSAKTAGRVTLGLVYDLKPPRNPLTGAVLDPSARRGFRGEGSWQHAQDLGNGWHDRVDASFVSDGYYVRDLVADVLGREAQYQRSTATVFHRTEEHWGGVDVTLRQDLAHGFHLFESDPVPGPAPLQRLPALSFAIPEKHLAGPLEGSIRTELVRMAPVTGMLGDCAQQAPPSPVGQPPPLDFGIRCEARERLDVNPRVSASLPLGRFANLAPYAAWREDLYYGEVSGQGVERGYPMAGVLVSTALARSGTRFRHIVEPSFEVRSIPYVFGEPDKVSVYDAIDAAYGPRTELLAGQAVVRNRLLEKTPSGLVVDRLLLDLGQNFHLISTETSALGDSWARLALPAGRLNFNAVARFDPNFGRIAQISAGVTLDDGKGDGLAVAYDRLQTSGSDRTRAGIDQLIGPVWVPPRDSAGQPVPDDFAEQISAGVHGRIGWGFQFHYEALIARQQLPWARHDLNDLSETPPVALTLLQQVLGLSYGPKCDCWRIEVHAIHRPLDTSLPSGGTTRTYLRVPDFGASLSISGFGSFGTGT